MRSTLILRWLLVPAVLFAFAATTVEAQRSQVKGLVTAEDGTPVAGATVYAQPTDGKARPQKAKTKKKGTFLMPFVGIGTYKFRAEKDGMLMSSMDVSIALADKRVEEEDTVEVGALQEVREYDIHSGRTVVIDFVMVPKSHFDDVMVVPGDKDATLKLNEANELSVAGAFAESSAILQGIVDAGEGTGEIYYLLGANAFAMGELNVSRGWLEKTLEVKPDQIGLHAHLAAIAHEDGDDERAVELYAKELEIAPETQVVAVNRAILLSQMGRTDDAVEAFRKVIELNPEDANAYSELAGLYLEQGREDEAMAVLSELESIGEPNPVLWYNIGANFSNRDLDDQAEAAYRKALTIQPDFAEAFRELGYLCVRRGDLAGAVAEFDRYLELRPAAADAEQVRGIAEALRKKATAQ